MKKSLPAIVTALAMTLSLFAQPPQPAEASHSEYHPHYSWTAYDFRKIEVQQIGCNLVYTRSYNYPVATTTIQDC